MDIKKVLVESDNGIPSNEAFYKALSLIDI